jgi:hypothetical protein
MAALTPSKEERQIMGKMLFISLALFLSRPTFCGCPDNFQVPVRVTLAGGWSHQGYFLTDGCEDVVVEGWDPDEPKTLVMVSFGDNAGDFRISPNGDPHTQNAWATVKSIGLGASFKTLTYQAPFVTVVRSDGLVIRVKDPRDLFWSEIDHVFPGFRFFADQKDGLSDFPKDVPLLVGLNQFVSMEQIGKAQSMGNDMDGD